MNEVVDLAAARAAREPHRCGPCKCLNPECRHEWVAAIPDTVQEPFQCPKCELMRGMWNCIFDVGSGQARFVCHWCKGDYFIVRRTDVLCIGCGVPTTFSELAEC